MRHAHLAAVALVDQRHALPTLVVVRMPGRDLVEQPAVDQVNDLQVARQQPFEERHRPHFERLGQQRVVRVGEHSPRDVPGEFPIHLVLVHQQANELGDRERRMRVVQLDRPGVGQRLERPILGQVLRQHVLQARADEEILLLEAQFLALRRRVVGIQDARDVLRLDVLGRGLGVPAGVEGFDVERRDRTPRPQPQVVDGRAAIAGNQLVEADRPDVVGVHPAVTGLAMRILRSDAATAEADQVAGVAALDLPGNPVTEPAARRFTLPAVLVDRLGEDAVVVADAVADGRVLQRGERVEEARRQPPEAAVAEARVDFLLGDPLQVETEFGQRLARLLDQLAVEARQPVDQ